MKLTGIHSLDDLDLEDSVCFIRVDFNVPLEGDHVEDDFRIRKAIPTLQYALGRGAKVVLASHLGRPGGQTVDELSLEPVGAKLAEITGLDVLLSDDHFGDPVERVIDERLDDRQVMLLENLRFDPGEKSADPEFADGLVSLADVYVDDAFGAMHRKHASIYTMVQHFDRDHKAVGKLPETEVRAFNEAFSDPKRPFTALMGGAKISDKIGVLDTLVEKVDNLLIGGAMAFTFLRARGTGVGSSRVEEDKIDVAEEVLEKAKRRDVDVLLPLDHVVAPDVEADETEIRTTTSAAIKAGLSGFDIGPNTVDMFGETIRNSRMVFWNGPMGVFERDAFAEGTTEIARTLAFAPCHSVVGGGDSASAIRKAEVAEQIDHVSTGGGAALRLVEGKSLPGLEALRANHPFD